MISSNMTSISIRIDKDMKDQLAEVFKREGMSFSSGIRYLCYHHLQEARTTELKTTAKEATIKKTMTNEDTNTHHDGDIKYNSDGEPMGVYHNGKVEYNEKYKKRLGIID